MADPAGMGDEGMGPRTPNTRREAVDHLGGSGGSKKDSQPPICEVSRHSWLSIGANRSEAKISVCSGSPSLNLGDNS
jgi:hypothetical protein